MYRPRYYARCVWPVEREQKKDQEEHTLRLQFLPPHFLCETTQSSYGLGKSFGEIFLLFFRSSCCLQLILIFQNTNANRCVTLYCYNKFVHHNHPKRKKERKKKKKNGTEEQLIQWKSGAEQLVGKSPPNTIYLPTYMYRECSGNVLQQLFRRMKICQHNYLSHTARECLIFFMNLFSSACAFILSFLIIDLIIRKEDGTSASNHEKKIFHLPSPVVAIVIVIVPHTGYILYS